MRCTARPRSHLCPWLAHCWSCSSPLLAAVHLCAQLPTLLSAMHAPLPLACCSRAAGRQWTPRTRRAFHFTQAPTSLWRPFCSRLAQLELLQDVRLL